MRDAVRVLHMFSITYAAFTCALFMDVSNTNVHIAQSQTPFECGVRLYIASDPLATDTDNMPEYICISQRMFLASDWLGGFCREISTNGAALGEN